MQTPVEITFRGMSSSPAVETSIKRWASRLDQNCERIQRCAVLVERPHHHHRQGNQFHIRIDLSVPGKEISVARDPERDPAHEDVYVALADAFRAARRQLQDHVQIRRGDIKRHA